MPRWQCWLSAGLVATSTLAAHAVTQSDLTVVGGDSSRSLFGKGSGVIVGICDQGVDANHPALRGSAYRQMDFTGSGSYDDSTSDAGHGTGIASLYVGHDRFFTGLAPSARFINARIVTTDDQTTDRIAGNGMFYALRYGAKVINLSIGASPEQGPTSNKLNLMVDYATEKYRASVVTAAGNEAASAVDYTPGGSYNAYSVGALEASRFNQVSSFSNYALKSDRRTKPDLVAPGVQVNIGAANWEQSNPYIRADGTSFSAPIVGGVLTQMIGYGQRHELSTNPLLLKAVLLTSARKVWDYDGSAWSPRHRATDKQEGVVFDEPLDKEQGAGRLDATAAYYLYNRKPTAATPVDTWRTSSLQGGHSYSLQLGNLHAGERVDATLTWFRHVAYKDNGNGIVDGSDTFSQSGTLADFSLILLRDGKPVVTSDSNVDNLEHLSWYLSAAGNYSLKAYRYGGLGLANEQFALAGRVLDNAPALKHLSVAGDMGLGGGGVTQGLSAGLSSVPEPSSLCGSLLMGAMLCTRRRRIS